MSRFGHKIMGMMHHPLPKSSFLPYHYYDEDHHLFVNEENAIGFLIETNTMIGPDPGVMRQFSLLFDEFLPQGGVLQFMLMGSSNVSSITDPWEAGYLDCDRKMQEMAKRRADFLSKLAKEGWSDDNFRTRNYRLIISYAKVMPYTPASRQEILDFKQKLEGVLRACDMHPSHLNVNDFLALVTEIISPEAGVSPFNPLDSLSEQIAPGDPWIVYPETIEHGENFTSQCFTIEKPPKNGMSLHDMINLLGDGTRSNLQISGRQIISLAVCHALDHGKQRFLKEKGQSALKHSDSFFGRFDPRLRLETEEWLEVEKQLAEGKKFITTSLMVVLTAKKKEFERAKQSLLSIYKLNDIQLKATYYAMKLAFLSVLPFAPACGLLSKLRFLNLAKTSTTQEVLGCLPIHGEWKGNGYQGMLLAGRRGQLACWNPFVSQANYNVVVIGESGSGKSVLTQDLLSHMIAQGTRVFLTDIGRSYQKLCSQLGGEFIEFNARSNICLNPFSNVTLRDKSDEEDFLSYVVPVIAKMVAPKSGTTDLEDALIKNALQVAWNRYRNKTDIDKLIECLYENNVDIAKHLAEMLRPYAKDGMYGKYFNGESNITFGSCMTVIEFDEIKDREDLMAVVMQIMNTQIMSQIILSDRKQRFMIVVEEASFGLRSFPLQLRSLAATVRKYNTSLMIVTQSYSDFSQNMHATSILDNVSWRITLPQTPAALNSITNSRKKDNDEPLFEPSEIALMRSLSMKPGRFSEFLMSSKAGYVVCRLILDPFSRLLFSTKAEEYSRLQSLLQQGASIEEAIEQVLEMQDA
jgi:conjugal transfer ATP-binding protein TraC